MSEHVIETHDEHTEFLGLLEAAHNPPKPEIEGFTEPVLRCDSCNKIVMKGTITSLGLCNHCGNKRFRPVDVISELELMQIKKLDGADAFLALFHDPSDKLVDDLFTSAPLLGIPEVEVSDEK